MRIIITLRKLKAGLSALIGNDKRKTEAARQIFYEDSIVEHEECPYSEKDNIFREFLEADDLNVEKRNVISKVAL